MASFKVLSGTRCAAHGVLNCTICSPSLSSFGAGAAATIDGVISPGDGTDILPDPTKSEVIAVESLEAVATVRGPVRELPKSVKKTR